MMRLTFAIGLALSVVVLALASPAFAQHPVDEKAQYGTEWVALDEPVRINKTPPRSVTLMADALAHSDEPRRAQLVNDIGRTQLAEGVPVLREQMQSQQTLVAAAACRGAGLSKQAKLAPDVAKMVSHPDPRVQREAVLSAHVLQPGSDVAIKATSSALKASNASVVAAALSTAQSAHADQIWSMYDKLSPRNKLHAVRALGRVQAKKYADDLAKLASKGDIPTRAVVAEALGAMEATDQYSAVERMLKDKHPSVRRYAVASLQTVATVKQRQQHGLKMLKDRDLPVREAAVRLLQANPLPAMADPIAQQLSEPYRPLHAAAQDALWNRGDGELYDDADIKEACIAAAVKVVGLTDPDRHVDGAKILGRWRSDAAIDRLMALCKVGASSSQKQFIAARWCAWALGMIGDQKAAPALLPGLDRKTNGAWTHYSAVASYSEHCIVALGRMGYTDALPKMVVLWKANKLTEDSRVRSAALWAQGYMGGDDAGFSNKCAAIFRDEEDTQNAKIEAVKALGNLRIKKGKGTMQKAYEGELDPFRYIAFWSLQRIGAIPADQPYDVPPHSWLVRGAVNAIE